MTTPKLGLAELTIGQSGKEITHNQALTDLDQLVNCSVLDKDLATPPGSPANGAAYIVGGSPTGAWAGQAGKLAFWYASTAAWVFKTPQPGWWAWVVDESLRYEYKSGAWNLLVTSASATQCVSFACSDETTAITPGTQKVTVRMPHAFTVSAIRASLSTAQTSGSILTIDVNKSGTSFLSTKITIDNTERTSVTAATPPVMSSTSLADDEEITVDIDQVGDGTAKGLKVYLIGTVP